MAIAVRTAKILTIVLIVSAFALTATTLAVLTVNQNVGSTGTITTSPNIGVYSDSGCTQNMTTFNWGTIAAGSSDTQTIYVKNTGTGTMTLSMSVSSWTPTSASTYMTLTWNKGGTHLSAQESTTATLTLTVASDIEDITNFSNSITISGTG
jgi:hypothetical protein